MKPHLILAIAFLAACGGKEPEVAEGLNFVARAPVRDGGGCAVEPAWVVTDVAGVALSRPSIMTPRLAETLERYVRTVAVPAVGERGGGLAEITVAAHYACRTRNNQRGARLSEHAKGRAIDISSFVMRDGSRVTVLDGWNKAGDRTLLRRLHSGACGPFGTVLGPNADRHHRDHFHFDVAAYRSGAYCR